MYTLRESHLFHQRIHRAEQLTNMIIAGIIFLLVLAVMIISTRPNLRSAVVTAIEAAERCQLSIAGQLLDRTDYTQPLRRCSYGPYDPAEMHVRRIYSDTDGVIYIELAELDANMDGHIVTLSPRRRALSGDTHALSHPQIQWRCGNPFDGTTLAPRYLPSACGGL